MAENTVSRIEPQPQAREVWTSPTPATFIENVAVRPNGHLLLSTFEDARLYTVNPHDPAAQGSVVTELPDVTALTGIAEISPDVFAIGAGVKAPNFSFEDGSMKVFRLSFSGDKPDIEHIADVPGNCINGMTALQGNRHIVLAAHSFNGSIQRINTTTGKVDIAFADPALELIQGKDLPVGVNGIRAVGRYLYFANSIKGLFGRVPITSEGGRDGEIEILARHPGETGMAAAYDDFAIMPDESVAYLCTHPNRIMRVDLRDGSKQELFFDGSGADGAFKLYAPTSAALSSDGKCLYVVTGGMGMSGGKMQKVGAQVVEIQLP
jgi:hypothetical protein